MSITRPRRTRAALALVALFVAAAARPAIAADDYTVVFDRPYKVGDAYHVEATSTDRQDRTVQIPDMPAQSETVKKKTTLAGDVKVLAVTEKGRPTKLTLTIANLEISEGDGPASKPLKPGQVLVLTRNGDEKVAALEGGGDLPPAVAAAVNELVSAADPQSPTEDESFGTKDRKKVGDEWDVNAESLRASSLKQGIPVAKDGVRGKVKLVEVRREGGVESGVYDLNVTAVGEKGGKMPKLPPGFAIDELTLKVTGHKVAPLDPALHTTAETLDVAMNLKVAGAVPNAGLVTITVKAAGTKEHKFSAVK